MENINIESNHIETEVEKLHSQEEYYYNVCVVLLKFLFKITSKVLKFSLYLLINFLKLFLKVIEGMFLSDYKPFKPITDKYEEFQNKRKEELMKDTEPHAVVFHSYEFIRNRTFASNYANIDKLLTNCVKHEAELNQAVKRDILKRIDILIVEAEKQAHIEGYKYGQENNFRFSEQEEFEEYIKEKVMRGEDYRDVNKKLLDEFKAGHH